MTWTAEITNDPDRGFSLYLELLEGEEARARIQRNGAGVLELRIYGPGETRIPASWLRTLVEGAEKDT